jgi:hypothetical protein
MGMVEREKFAAELPQGPKGLEEIAGVRLVSGGTGQSVSQRNEVGDKSLTAVDVTGEQATAFVGQGEPSMVHQLEVEHFRYQQLIKRVVELRRYHRKSSTSNREEESLGRRMPETVVYVIIS